VRGFFMGELVVGVKQAEHWRSVTARRLPVTHVGDPGGFEAATCPLESVERDAHSQRNAAAWHHAGYAGPIHFFT
jgi:hypothetical protein